MSGGVSEAMWVDVCKYTCKGTTIGNEPFVCGLGVVSIVCMWFFSGALV